jgi:dTDP-4-amino-4,6-dideoxygalactose transaminase
VSAVNRYAPSPPPWRLIASAMLRPAHAGAGQDGMLSFPGAHVQLTPSAREAIRRVLARMAHKGVVLVPAFTCLQVVDAVRAAGHAAKFVDVDAGSGVVTPAAVAAAMDADCRAVLVSHLFTSRVDVAGVVAAVDGRADVIEDSALVRWQGQALTPGTSALVFSTGRGKPLGIGAGGACIVPGGQPWPAFSAGPQDAGDLGLLALLAAAARGGAGMLALSRWVSRLRGSGQAPEAAVAALLRPRELSAAAHRSLAAQMQATSVSEAATRARALISRYRQALGDQLGKTVMFLHDDADSPPGGLATPALPLAVPRRDACLAALRRAGFDVPAYWRYSAAQASGDACCPVSERLAQTLLYLPLHPGVRQADVEAMADIIGRHARA